MMERKGEWGRRGGEESKKWSGKGEEEERREEIGREAGEGREWKEGEYIRI